MTKTVRSTTLTPDEDEAIRGLCRERKWSTSQVLRELIAESPTFKSAMKRLRAATRSKRPSRN
jgi:hypothetical protein